MKRQISKLLQNKIPVFYYDVTDSTNLRAREYIQNGGKERALFVANAQSAGRGRLGRSFYSPQNSGIYMSYLLKAEGELCDAVNITTATAVAVADAIGERAKIKWVNDIYIDQKKVCGILTEAVSFEGELYVVIGIGINVTTSDFPDDIKDIAGNIGECDKSALIAKICDNLTNVQNVDYIDNYRQKLLWKGEDIVYIENNVCHNAVLVDVDSNGHLIVDCNGNKKTLRSGEISIKTK